MKKGNGGRVEGDERRVRGRERDAGERSGKWNGSERGNGGRVEGGGEKGKGKRKEGM